jgi:hypothetical protein
MARIAAGDNNSIMKIKAFLGLNENPDGDTALDHGELSEMRNFKITQDKHLQIRPGSKVIVDLSALLEEAGGETTPESPETRIYGVWRGFAGPAEHTIAAYAGVLWDIDLEAGTAKAKGKLTEAETSFFGFGGNVYCLNGHEYMVWNGEDDTEFAEVEGYIPVIQTATTPAGAGTLLENVNRLTGKRRVEFSPDGSATEFVLPEKEIDEVISAKVGDDELQFTADITKGTVKMSAAPAKGVNTLTITYRKGEGARDEVVKMRYSELYNGGTDTRVFLYGNGTNKTIYSGVEYVSGEPSAEYFPDLYEVEVGETNTPITALVRHYSRMMAYKPNSAWVIQYGTIALDNAVTTAAFYVLPTNRQFGNEALGQVKLLENNPLTLDVGSVYQWRSTSSTGNINSSESNARRVSDRVGATLSTFDIKKTKTANIKSDHEYWFIYNRQALILNYSNDAWYRYTNLPFDLLLEVENEKYGFSGCGKVFHFDRAYRNDDGEPIDAYAATGSMDFDKEWLLKYSPMVFVAIQPESNARISVTVETNKRSDYPEKVVAAGVSTLSHVNFSHFSFRTNRKPQVKRVKLKVKKATFYKLIFKSNSASATATVIETDVQLRYAGRIK